MTLAPGTQLGPYAIRAELGHGGMGVVYTVQDPRLKRQVAIMLLTPDLTRDETAQQRQCNRRARRCTNRALTSPLRADIVGTTGSVGVGTPRVGGANPPVGAGSGALAGPDGSVWGLKYLISSNYPPANLPVGK